MTLVLIRFRDGGICEPLAVNIESDGVTVLNAGIPKRVSLCVASVEGFFWVIYEYGGLP